MSMSVWMRGLTKNDETYKQRYSILKNCCELEIEAPKEILDYFGIKETTIEDITAEGIEKGVKYVEKEMDGCIVYEIDTEYIQHFKSIRVYIGC